MLSVSKFLFFYWFVEIFAKIYGKYKFRGPLSSRGRRGGDGKAIMGRPLKKTFFAASLKAIVILRS